MRNKAVLITGIVSLSFALIMVLVYRQPTSAAQGAAPPPPKPAIIPPPAASEPPKAEAPKPPPAPAKPKVLGHVAGWEMRKIKELVDDREAHRRKLEEAAKAWNKKNPDAKALIGIADNIERWVTATAKEFGLAPRCFVLDLSPAGRDKCAASHDVVWGLDEAGDILPDAK